MRRPRPSRVHTNFGLASLGQTLNENEMHQHWEVDLYTQVLGQKKGSTYSKLIKLLSIAWHYGQ